MIKDVQSFVESKRFSSAEIAAKTREIYQEVLRTSPDVDRGNFTSIHTDDLQRIVDLYDELFFERGLRRLLGETPLYFRLSNRMTRAAGMATSRRIVDDRGQFGHRIYELVVSTTLLFQTFREDDRPVTMSGIVCRDRLEALQRIVEHEMVHLIELRIWDDSKCQNPRFQDIARRFFAHTEHWHELITPRERALTKYGIQTGDKVAFRFDGQQYVGVVNRITKRATVLVESQRGQLYSDGKRYAKYYVPVPLLQSLSTHGS